jgi:hypothetical protein
MTITSGWNTSKLVGKLFSIDEKTMTFNGKNKHHMLICIPIGIWVACSLYKLVHGIDYLQCFEMFAIEKLLINMVLHEIVYMVNMFSKMKFNG